MRIFVLSSCVVQKPTGIVAHGAPPIKNDLFYCGPDGRSHPIGSTGITIQEGLWLILRAIDDDTATTPDRNDLQTAEARWTYRCFM